MITRKEQMTAGAIDGYNNFLGNDSDYQDWLGILGRSRDSGCLEESNFNIGLAMLGGESDTVRVERFGHWAVGWIEEVYVKPGSEAAIIALKIERSIENYPILDDEDFSNREMEEANKTWLNCYDIEERIKYIRNYPSQFEFIDYADLIGCVRGKYFIGYASELISN